MEKQSDYQWFVLHVNPEPWTIGPVMVGRKKKGVYGTIGRNQGLYAYQQTVKAAVSYSGPMLEGSLELIMFFWRNRADYTTHQARTVRKNEADATNMGKALEDALQGVLYKNDKDVKINHNFVIEQGPAVTGKIVLGVRKIPAVRMYTEFINLVPYEIQALAAEMNDVSPFAEASDNSWGGPFDEEFDEYKEPFE